MYPKFSLELFLLSQDFTSCRVPKDRSMKREREARRSLLHSHSVCGNEGGSHSVRDRHDKQQLNLVSVCPALSWPPTRSYARVYQREMSASNHRPGPESPHIEEIRPEHAGGSRCNGQCSIFSPYLVTSLTEAAYARSSTLHDQKNCVRDFGAISLGYNVHASMFQCPTS